MPIMLALYGLRTEQQALFQPFQWIKTALGLLLKFSIVAKVVYLKELY